MSARDQDLCVKCGANPINRELGEKRCQPCREKAAAAAKAARAAKKASGKCPNCGDPTSNPARCDKCKAKLREAQKERTNKRRADGVCVTCNKRPARPGRITCGPCSQEATDNSSAKYHQRKAAGTTCRYCDAPPAAGATMCEKHLADRRDNAAQLKLDAIQAYGGPSCVSCDLTTISRLGVWPLPGAVLPAEIASVRDHGISFYRALRRSGYPEGFQVLCTSCCHK